MQEIADFFGCPCALNGFSLDNSVALFEECHLGGDSEEPYKWHGPGLAIIFSPLVSDAENHDWTILVKPKEGE